MTKRAPRRLPAASQLSTWENEGGGIPAATSADSARDQAFYETPGPLKLNELARVTLNSIADAVISTDADGKVAYMNATAVKMTGWTLQQAVGRTMAEVFRVVDATTGEPAPDPGLHAISENQAVSLALNCVLVRRDGSEVEIEDSAAPIHDRHGRLVGAVIIFRDVRFSHAMVDRMLFLARHDPLTGQANRFALDEQFDLARRMARRHHWKIGVLFVDIDRFKFINDSLGHDAGDEVLVKVAKRLAGCLRESDTLSRYGGDEFVVLLSETQHSGDTLGVARKLQAAMADPELIAGHAVDLSLSIGSSVYPDDGEDLRTLLQKADQTMMQTRTASRSTGASATSLR
ncbi:MAG: diguanylate cyclase domain-containing protein [Wenzhouxiangella sp.]